MKCVCLTLLAALSLLHTCSSRNNPHYKLCSPENLMEGSPRLLEACANFYRRSNPEQDDTDIRKGNIRRRQDHTFMHFGRR